MATSPYMNIYRYACPGCQSRFKTSRSPNYEVGEKIENAWCPNCYKIVPCTLDNYVGGEDTAIPVLYNLDRGKQIGTVTKVEHTDDEIIITVRMKKDKLHGRE